MTVRQIKTEAKERFTVNRYQAMLAYCIVFFIVLNVAVVTAALCVLTSSLNLPSSVKYIVASVLWWYGLILILIVLVLTAPFSYSMTNFFMKSYKGKKMDVSMAFDGFNKYNLERVIVAFLLRFILTLLLTCLAIVPGIIFSIKTSMAFYLMRANPKMKPVAALKASSKVMKGHSGAYFKMLLSFIGWFLLGVFTFTAGFIYILPYFNTCKVVFYKRELQGDKTAYNLPTISMERTGEPEGDRAAAVVPDEEEEEDDSNVALKLMKVQLEGEIKSVDSKIEETKKKVTNPQIAEAEPAPDANAYVQSDDLDEQIATVSKLIESGESETAAVADQDLSVTAEPVQPIIAGMTDDGEEENYEINETGADQHTAAREAIKQRIEQLKRERDMRTGHPTRPVRPKPAPVKKQPEKTPVTPVPAPAPAAPVPSAVKPGEKNLAEKAQTASPFVTANPKVITDEFAPEKIDVEIIEE